MKILLINPRTTNIPAYSLGLLYLASLSEEEGHSVRIIDKNIPPESMAHEAVKFSPDVIGMTSLTPQYDHAIEIAEEIKHMTNTPIIIGGIHPTALPKDAMKSKGIDFVVIGEAEHTFMELINNLNNPGKVNGIAYRKNGKVLFTRPRKLIQDLDSIPYPAYHLLESDIYFLPPKMRGTWAKRTGYIITSRGCPYHCIYCGSHNIFGRKVRRRSVNNVIGEIELLRKTKSITAVYFLDDTFTIDEEWVKRFCRILIKKNWNFVWGCQARVDTLNDIEMLKLMKKSGNCQIDIGVESGSQRCLNILKKGITVEQTRRTFRLLHEVGLRTFASWIIGIPGETEDDIRQTEELLDEIKPNFSDFNYFMPYVGTECYGMAKKMGIETDYSKMLMNKLTEMPSVCFNGSPEELVKFRTRLYRKILFRNYMCVVKPKNIKGIICLFIRGIGGLRKGIPKFFRTGNFDDIIQSIISHRRNMEFCAIEGRRRMK